MKYGAVVASGSTGPMRISKQDQWDLAYLHNLTYIGVVEKGSMKVNMPFLECLGCGMLEGPMLGAIYWGWLKPPTKGLGQVMGLQRVWPGLHEGGQKGRTKCRIACHLMV